MAQVLQDNEQAVREAAASTSTDRTHGTDGSDDRSDVPPEVVPNGADSADSGDSNGTVAGTAPPTWPAHSSSRRPPRPRPRRCTQQRLAGRVGGVRNVRQP